MKNKKALSTVIATVLLILLVITSTAIVWAFVRNIVEERTTGAKSCFDVESSEKVAINEYYTCYNSTDDEVQFSISIADVEIDSLIVSIAYEGSSKSFTLTNDLTNVSDLKPYKGEYEERVVLPGENEGKTYVARTFDGVDSIKIAPIIDNKQCGLTDAVYEIGNCALLVN